MNLTAQCVHCSKPFPVPPAALGKRVRCLHCKQEFVLTEFHLVGARDAPPGSAGSSLRPGPAPPPGRGRPTDSTLSHSMLQIPSMARVPPEEMLCRLEPETLRWVNITEAVEKFLGSPIERLRQRTFLEFLHPDDRALAADEFRRAGELGERHDFILRIRGQDGQWHFVRIYAQARYDPDGTINHIRCYLKDVTERIKAEQELRRRTDQLTTANERLRQTNLQLKQTQGQLVHSEKLAALGTLAAGMAHEINNPLAFAANNVAVLERDIARLLEILACYRDGFSALERDRPELAARIAQLQEEVDLPYIEQNLPRLTQATRRGLGRVAQIVENLRGFANLDQAEIGVIDVNQTLDRCLGVMNNPLSQSQIAVERRYGALPPLECAVAHLNQVFLNLLMNAMQAIQATGRPSGTIRVETGLDDGAIVVEVADDGTGIPPEVLPKIFDPFFTTKPIGRGTGLGLSISHNIIAEHGGRIDVRSAVGQGTTFRVRLPVCRPERRPPAVQGPEESALPMASRPPDGGPATPGIGPNSG
jgi:two-component system, NtrC family, sensor kinase